MTLREFKAWLEGYEEGFTPQPPTEAQWVRIKEKLASVEVYATGGHIGPKYNFLVGANADGARPINERKP